MGWGARDSPRGDLSSNESRLVHPGRTRALLFLVLGCVYVAVGALFTSFAGQGTAAVIALGGVAFGLVGYRSLGAMWAVPR